MKKINYIIISVLFSLLFIVLYLSLGNEKIYNTQDLVGKKISEVEINLFQSNETFNTKELTNNEFTILNFWASWCAPCKIEHPILMKLSQKKNLMLLGVNFKDKEPQAKIFLSELGNPYDLLAKDKNGKHSVKFGIYGIPESILINKELMIIQKFVGPLSVDDYNNIIKIIE